MSFLEKLSSIVKIDVSSLKGFTVRLVSLGDGNTFGLVNVHKEKKEVHLHIDSQDLDREKRRQVLKIINEEVSLEDRPLLEAEVSERIIEIKEEQLADHEIISFFEDKIPSDDMKVLKSALYLRKISSPGASIDKYIQEIRYKYGQHGANIVHLCDTGYFESHIKPMYEELSSRPNFQHQLFVDNYNLIIDNVPIAVFVKRADTVETLIDQVLEKVTFNRGYGLRELHIHAIGYDNVEKVKKLLSNDRLVALFINEPTVSIDGTIVNATIYC
jgi:hypothetical protein